MLFQSRIENQMSKGNVAMLFTIFLSLSYRDRFKFSVLTLFNILISFLDALAIALVGLVTALSFSLIQGAEPGNRSNRFLKLSGIENLSPQTQIYALLGLAILTFISKTFLSLYVMRKAFMFMSSRAALLSISLLRKIMTSPITELRKVGNQEFVHITSVGTNLLLVSALAGAGSLLGDVMMLLSIFLVMSLIDLKTALITLFGFFCVGAITWFLAKDRTTRVYMRYSDLQISTGESLINMLDAFREIYARNSIEFYLDSFSKNKMEAVETSASMRMIPLVSKYILEVTVLVFIFIVTASQFIFNEPTRAAANAALFIAASTRLGPAVIRIQQGMISIKGSLAGAEATFRLLQEGKLAADDFSKIEAHNETANTRSSRVGIQKSGMLAFDLDSVKYSHIGSKNHFNFASLKIPEKSFTALVGPSGGGKSTLIDLMTGVIEPLSGSIRVYGIRPREAIESGIVRIGYVPQKVTLISGTILDNILLGIEPNEQNIENAWRALRKVGLEGKVREMNSSIEARIGKRADGFSGGEIQRLGVARALVLNPEILILDESTSSLDAISEKRIANLYSSLKSKTTVIVVAHRLSTITKADEIIYIDQGKISTRGNYGELRRKFPKFEEQVQALDVNKE